VFGDAEAVIERAVAAGRIKAGCATDCIGRNAGEYLDRLRTVALLRNEGRPVLKILPIAVRKKFERGNFFITESSTSQGGSVPPFP
jgi:hypothetical protein